MASAKQQRRFQELERLERLQRRLRGLIDRGGVDDLIVAADELEDKGFMELAEYYRERARRLEEEENARRPSTSRVSVKLRDAAREHWRRGR